MKCDIIIWYKDGTSKVIGPFNAIIANTMAIFIAMKPHVLMVRVQYL